MCHSVGVVCPQLSAQAISDSNTDVEFNGNNGLTVRAHYRATQSTRGPQSPINSRLSSDPKASAVRLTDKTSGALVLNNVRKADNKRLLGTGVWLTYRPLAAIRISRNHHNRLPLVVNACSDALRVVASDWR